MVVGEDLHKRDLLLLVISALLCVLYYYTAMKTVVSQTILQEEAILTISYM